MQERSKETSTSRVIDKKVPVKPNMASIGLGPDNYDSLENSTLTPPHKKLSEQDQYLLKLSDGDRNQYNNLIQKNMKIRGELIEIATQMDVLAGRERADKMEKMLDGVEGNAELRELEDELKQQENYLSDLTSRLQERRKLVNEVLKINELQEKENMLVFLKKKIDEFTKEKAGIDRIIGKQRAELDANDIDDSKKQRVDSGSQIKEIQEEIEEMKVELKRAKERVAEEERQSKFVHDELAQIRKSKNKVKECITIIKHKQPLPKKVRLANTRESPAGESS